MRARATAGARAAGRDPGVIATTAILWLVLALFVCYPLARVAIEAFRSEAGLSVHALGAVLGHWANRQAFWNSLVLATLVGVFGTALGFAFALAVLRARLGRAATVLLDAVTVLPLISPPFVSAIAIIFSFGPRGLLTYHLLGITGFQIYGLRGTLLSEGLTYFPLAYLTLRGVLASLDPNLEDMARSLGAGRWHVFRSVTLPLTVPGLANSFLLCFAASLADFATPLILAGQRYPVLPTQAYLQITGLYDFHGGAALSLVLLGPALAVFLLQRYWVGRRVFVTVTGRAGPQSQPQPVGALGRALLVVICGLTTGLVLFFYGLIFLASIVRALGANHTLTAAHYLVVATTGWKAVRDTLVIALVGMPLGGLYGVALGYVVARTEARGRRWMEFVALMNYALPGTIVGIGYLIAFNGPPLVLTGTAVIIVACYVFRYSPAGIRATVALLQQIDRALEEASTSLGASRFVTFRRVVLPLVMPAFLAGLAVVFIRSMTAISATIFLVSVNWTLLTVRILEAITELELGTASAFAMLVIALVYAMLALLGWVLRRLRTREAGTVASLLEA
ncbi:MAG: iron ABC transporter permease [Candidatus Rokubacteria bacterium]|nr:iron ABC transporter permease [Candidatus Rokubacteria bacterium]